MALGPVQLLTVGFDEPHFTGAALDELKRLRDQDIVRLIDLLVVAKDDDGNVTKVEIADRPELAEYGALVGAFLGLGAAGEEGMMAGAEAGAESMAAGKLYDDEDVWVLADEIPPGMTAAICVLEHRWAIPLRNAILDAGGTVLVDEWMHPDDLVRYGAEAAAR